MEISVIDLLFLSLCVISVGSQMGLLGHSRYVAAIRALPLDVAARPFPVMPLPDQDPAAINQPVA